MFNETNPVPPYKSCGCFNCGDGQNEILVSRTIGALSKALCKHCDENCDPRQIGQIPYNSR